MPEVLLAVPQGSSTRKLKGKYVRSGALPLSQQILLDLLVPPIGTAVWWLMARGWASIVQGGNTSETTQKRQKWETWIILILAYVLMFGITIYGQLR